MRMRRTLSPTTRVTLKNGSGDYTFHTLYMSDVRSGRMGGVAPSLDQIAGETKVSAYMPLQEAKGVLRSQFDLDAMILTTNSMVIPVAEAVQCYNKATGEWYEVKDGDGKEGPEAGPGLLQRPDGVL